MGLGKKITQTGKECSLSCPLLQRQRGWAWYGVGEEHRCHALAVTQCGSWGECWPGCSALLWLAGVNHGFGLCMAVEREGKLLMWLHLPCRLGTHRNRFAAHWQRQRGEWYIRGPHSSHSRSQTSPLLSLSYVPGTASGIVLSSALGPGIGLLGHLFRRGTSSAEAP